MENDLNIAASDLAAALNHSIGTHIQMCLERTHPNEASHADLKDVLNTLDCSVFVETSGLISVLVKYGYNGSTVAPHHVVYVARFAENTLENARSIGGTVYGVRCGDPYYMHAGDCYPVRGISNLTPQIVAAVLTHIGYVDYCTYSILNEVTATLQTSIRTILCLREASANSAGLPGEIMRGHAERLAHHFNSRLIVDYRLIGSEIPDTVMHLHIALNEARPFEQLRLPVLLWSAQSEQYCQDAGAVNRSMRDAIAYGTPVVYVGTPEPKYYPLDRNVSVFAAAAASSLLMQDRNKNIIEAWTNV